MGSITRTNSEEETEGHLHEEWGSWKSAENDAQLHSKTDCLMTTLLGVKRY